MHEWNVLVLNDKLHSKDRCFNFRQPLSGVVLILHIMDAALILRESNVSGQNGSA